MRVLLSVALAGVMVSSTGYAAESLSFRGTHVSVPGGLTKMTFRLRGTPLREALQLIAESSNLNLILDDSVEGNVSLDFFQTPLNQILETMLYSSGFRLQPYGKSYVVYRSGEYGQPVMRFVPLKFVSAQTLLPTLYDLLDIDPPSAQGASAAQTPSASGSAAASSAADSATAPANKAIRDLFSLAIKTDTRSNRIVLTGPEDKVNQAEDLVRRLDVLTPSRIFPLNYISAKEAVDVLRASFFEAGEGSKPIASINKDVPDFGATTPGSRVTNRSEKIDVSQETPRFVPMPTQNALLVLGSNSELQLVDQVLKSVDKRRQQVIIRAQIVEMSVGDSRDLGLSYQAGSRQFDINTGRADGTLTFDSLNNVGLNVQVKLNALLSANRAKMLASPQLLAMDGRTSIIKITDQIIAKTETTISQSTSGQIIRTTVTPDEAGITLELTPRIDSRGGVTMNVHPVVSVAQPPTIQNGDIIATLKSTREYQAQEIYVRDGNTIVIGGLIQDKKIQNVTKLPLLGDIPFLGGLFQTRKDINTQTEVQIFLTPEVIKDADASPRA
ncbi:MAG TPA: secretin N-terminal domain-containing protein [Stenomitos sp.]